MSQFPNSIDDDSDIQRVDDNITEIGSLVINELRDAVFAIENNIGIGAQGSQNSIADRLAISMDATGHIKPSEITALGLVTLPITNAQISATAAISESKLSLDHGTTSLYNQIISFNTSLQTSLAYISDTGFKLEPHLQGVTYRHFMDHIDVAPSIPLYFKNRFGALRNNSNLYNLFSDINSDLVSHEKADSTNIGTVPPINYAHVASGILLNTTNFSFIPQTTSDLQQFAEFIDNSNIFLLGTRIQTFYSNGISRTARSGTLTDTTLGQLIIPSTSVTTYLLFGGSSSPVDDIDHGDDIIEFIPDLPSISNSTFDAKFSAIRIGDIITVNYGTFSVTSIIKEKKIIVSSPTVKRYVVRINRKNIIAGTHSAQVNKPLFNINKYGVLALAQANAPTNVLPSLIAGNPRGAQVLGIGFNADQIDQQHYNLYLQLYPNGNPTSQVVNLPAIDITGNKGKTPGEYTLDSIIESTNISLRAVGFNYRFIAYSYQGEFGIMLADPYNDASFSIIAGVLNSTGQYDVGLSNSTYSNNIIGVPGNDVKDALGFGPSGANLGSPPFSASFANYVMAQTPTKIFVPLTRNNYYINGVERERFDLEPAQLLDGYGDGYWPSTIINKQIIPGVRVEVTYQVNADLHRSGLKVGKTLVAQSGIGGTVVDSGRFFIKDIQYNNCDTSNAFTLITVYDAIHSTGITPFASAAVGTPVFIYFNGDSIGFNIENSSDFSTALVSFKRNFEIYINQDGYTFSHERGRLNISGSDATINSIPLYGSSELSNINIFEISPKLRGYQFSSVNKINLQITSYDSITGIFSGYLCQYDGSTTSNQGPTTIGKKGNVVRFYDQTNVDYIDFIFDPNDSISTFNTMKRIDVQLFPTLRLDEELMLLGIVQVNDSIKTLKYLHDKRQFGNISETQFSSSALDYIAKPTQLLQENGIIRGFDITSINNNNISINGGVAIVNGKIIQLDNEIVGIPIIQETLVPYGQNITFNTITWFICVNDKGEIEFVASTDFDPTTSGSTYDLIPVDHNRLFYAINPNDSTSVPYAIKATYLSDLISNFKDITLISVITSTISLVAGKYVVSSTINKDARRFIYNGYGGLIDPFVFGNNASFRSFESLNTWMDQLLKYKSSLINSNSVGQKVIVKGNTTISSTITLNYGSEVIFEGDGGTFTISSISSGFNLGSNITFKNITFNNLYDPISNSDPNYTSGLLANNSSAFLFCNVDATNGNKNIKIENCTFTSSLQQRYPFIVFNFASSGTFAENIIINNNKFNTTFASNDKLSVISLIGPNLSPTSTIGPRLINCQITNNICNKNQLIQLCPQLNSGAGKILDAIVGVNVKIANNTCGAINILTKYDIPFTTFNSSFSKDKNNGVIVYGNNCKFIYSGLSNGSIIDGYGVRAVSLINNGIFTGALAIENNTTSFIHIGQRIDSTMTIPNSNIIIHYNRLFAADSSASTGYLNDYYVGFIAPTYTFTSTAMIVDKIVGT